MKLILCMSCEDVFKLDKEKRFCKCGQTYGYYLSDELNAEYGGEVAIPIGFNNNSLVKAIRNQPSSGLGERFEAFVIPKKCDTMRKTNAYAPPH